MRIFRPTLIATAALTAVLAGGSLLAAGAETAEALRIGGSTTLLPVVAKCASDFMERHETWDKVDPALPSGPVVVFVTGGGSGFGVKGATDGTVEIGLVSRDLKEKEKKLLGDHRAIVVGRDSVAIAVNTRNPLAKARSGFTADEVARIFSGEIRTWRQLDASLPATEIVLLVRDSGAGSADIFQQLVLKERSVAKGALQMPSQGALLKKLESNPNAIAYVSSGLVGEAEGLKAFALDGVEPTNENVAAGRYTLCRPLLVVVRGTPSRRAQAFIDHLLADGQKVVAEQGFVPARNVQ